MGRFLYATSRWALRCLPPDRAPLAGCALPWTRYFASHARGWNEQDHRYRPRHDEQLCCHHGRQEHPRDRERGGHAHDPLDGGLHRGRRGAGRHAGQAAGGDQPREHPVRGQAADRPPLRGPGRPQGHGHGVLQDRQGRQWRRLGGGARREEGAGPGQRRSAEEDEGHRRALSRHAGREGRHHRAGLLQRQPASGDQGRRQDRRPRRGPDHQRADRGRPRLRHGQGPEPDHRGLRPRRRHLRRLGARDRRRRVRGEVDQRRHLPRRRGLRQAHHRLHGRRVQKGAPDRSAQRPPGAAAPEGGGREGEDRAVVDDADRGQPAVHHGGCFRPEASDHEDHPRQAGAAGRGPDREDGRALQEGAAGRGPEGRATSTR